LDALLHRKVNHVMTRFLRFVGARLKRLFQARVPFSAPTVGQVIAGMSALGVAMLIYLFGTATMYFQLPPADFLDKSFAGARAWHARGHRQTSPGMPGGSGQGVPVDDPERTCDGFTLFTAADDGAWAKLLDMRGTVVHHWELPFSRAWTHAPHVKDPLPDEQIHWFRCHLYGNGDLLAIYHADGDTPYGYGLVKLDKDSKLLWAYANHVHHDLDVGEDGNIYTLAQQIVSEPPADLEFLDPPYLTDSLVVLSPEGRELQNIPIAEAFANSPYAQTLVLGSKSANAMNLLGPGGAPPGPPIPPPGSPRRPNSQNDFLHTNSVKVLSRALAAKFPLFKAGQVLLSVRNLHTVAILDRHTRSVAWAAQGLWRLQHDAEFLDNGHLLLFDNFGSRAETRILEYDPSTQAIPWAYTNEDSAPFRAFGRGIKQRLPNGNTFIVDPDNRRLFEVTRDKELVWETFCPSSPGPPGQRPRGHPLTGARRYGADELTFLKGVARARP
jgi:hypothetical protein